MKNWRHLLIALLALVMLLVCGGVVLAGAESEELPPIPEEVAAVIGELPTSLDDLPEGFDPARLKEVHEAVDLEKAATELLENGSSTFSGGGIDWENPWMWINSKGTDTEVAVSLSAADNGQLTMKLDDALPNGGKYDGFVISVRGGDYYKQVNVYDIGTESEQIYNNTSQELPSTDGWNYMLSYDKDGQLSFTVISETPYFRNWTIKFDEQGEIVDTYYLADEEEAQPAEAEATELTYTPGEDLVLVDDNDVKIWITADGWYDDWNEQEYKSFTPLDDYSFVLAVIDWENKADEPRTIMYNGKINGYSIIDSGHWISLGDLPAHTTFSDERDDGFGNIIKQPSIEMSFYEELAEYNNIDEATVKEALKGPEYVLELNIQIGKPLSGNRSTDLYKTGPIIVHYNAENDSPSAKPEDVKPEADTLADTQADTQGDAQADGPSVVYTDKATVKAVQQALNDAGYNCGKPDGAAGKKTKAAITQYQTDKGLEVTGTVTDELLRSLGID